MSFIQATARFCGSSIGRKILVAVTGVAMVLFLAGHLAGNLLMYVGPDAVNEYAHQLKHMLHGSAVWIARFGLLACFVVHIYFTITLAMENKAARPQSYAMRKPVQATLASRTMVLSGLVVLSFVIYHLLHFTILGVDPRFKNLPHDAQNRPDVFTMVHMGFSNPLISGFYILSLFLLCTHLSHGIASLFQTLGLRSKKTAVTIKTAGLIYCAIIFLGFSSIPVSVLTGVIKPHTASPKLETTSVSQ